MEIQLLFLILKILVTKILIVLIIKKRLEFIMIMKESLFLKHFILFIGVTMQKKMNILEVILVEGYLLGIKLLMI